MRPTGVVWVDGRLVPREQFLVPSGLRQGDGVFETVRTYGGVPFRLDEHLSRLLDGAEALDLTSLPTLKELRSAVESLLATSTNGPVAGEWVLRPCVYSEEEHSGSVVFLDPLFEPDHPSGGRTVATGLSTYRHPGEYLRPRGVGVPVKWLARGPLAHALREARRRGWEEALLRNGDGEVVEGTRSNLIVLDGERLLAPGPAFGALPGITRSIVLGLAVEMGFFVEDHPPRVEQLKRASEAILTSTLLGVASVDEFEGQPLGTGHGPETLAGRLSQGFGELVRRETQRSTLE